VFDIHLIDEQLQLRTCEHLQYLRYQIHLLQATDHSAESASACCNTICTAASCGLLLKLLRLLDVLDKVIALDFFGQFDKKNLLGGATSIRYRRAVLEPGGSEAGTELVRGFLGRPQNLEAFKLWLEEEFVGGKN
jgi:Peptidase family M3